MQDQFVIAVLLGYLLVGAGLVVVMGGLRGVMAAIVIGWLFLPPARGVNLPGLPQYTKEFAVSYSILIGVIFSDSTRLLSFKPKIIDIPMLVWIIAPLFSSVTNGLGYYDGFSAVYFNLFVFGIPYLMGRIYIRTPNDVKTVAIWFIIAGLIAIPFALWESRMSPTLNNTIYGYKVHKDHMSRRLGGYRPTLFMRHGLEVGLWMATSSAVALWLWITSPKQFKVFNYKIPSVAIIVLFATLMSRSLGSLILLAGTTATAFFVRVTGVRIALIALVLFPSFYLTVRLSNVWAPDEMTSFISSINEERAKSLEARLGQELVISKHAFKHPLFGWGGQNRFRPLNDDGSFIPVDGMTTITLGKNGLVGLVSFLALTSLPSLLMILRIKGRDITSAIWAPAVGIMLGLAIFSMDMLFNAFYTPLHIIGFGVIASVAVNAKKWQRMIARHQQKMIYHQQSIQQQEEDTPNTPMPVPPNGRKPKRAS